MTDSPIIRRWRCQYRGQGETAASHFYIRLGHDHTPIPDSFQSDDQNTEARKRKESAVPGLEIC